MSYREGLIGLGAGVVTAALWGLSTSTAREAFRMMRGVGDSRRRFVVLSGALSLGRTLGVRSAAAQGSGTWRYFAGQRMPGQLESPGGIALLSDGNLVLTDSGLRSVQVLTPEGEPVTAWDATSFGIEYWQPVNLAVGHDDRVFVMAFSQHLSAFSGTGAPIAQWRNEGTSVRLGPHNFSEAAGLAISPSGNVVVADTGHHRVVWLTPDGGLVAEWGGLDEKPATFVQPTGVTFDAAGAVYVSDFRNLRLRRFTPESDLPDERSTTWRAETLVSGRELPMTRLVAHPNGTIWGYNGNGICQISADGAVLGTWDRRSSRGLMGLGGLGGLAFDAAGTAYVSDSRGGRIYLLSEQCEVIGMLPERLPKVYLPELTAVHRSGAVVVLGGGPWPLHSFDGAGQLLAAWGLDDLRPRGGSWFPSGMQFRGDALLIVNSGTKRLLQIDWPAPRVTETPLESPADDPLGRPAGLALAPDGSLYILDPERARVRRYTADGKHLSSFGAPGPAPGQLAEPRAVAVTADGTVYVTDTGNHRIQAFSPTGELVGVIGAEGSAPGFLRQPTALALDSAGRLYVSDTGNYRIQLFGRRGEVFGVWGQRGKEVGEFTHPTSLALDPAGRLYVVDQYVGGSVQRLERA